MTIDFLKQNNLILFEAISGSKSFGLATENSDTDIKGVFYLPKDLFYGLEYIPQVSNATNDIVYYEIGRFVELLLKNNPNILEILATPEDCILYKNPIMDKFRQEDFLSKLCKDTFGGYASTQIQKARGLNKKIVNPVEKERKGILDFCVILEDSNSIPAKDWLKEKNFLQENCGLVKMPNSKGVFALFYDDLGDKDYSGIYKIEDSNEVSLSSVPKEEKQEAYLFFNQDAYSIYCKNYKEYWEWVEKRNDDRYNTNQKHGKNYDSKNMMHTIRLLQSAVNIFRNNKIEIRVKNRDELLDIKTGNWDYDDLLLLADKLIEELNSLTDKSSLPDLPDKEKAERTLIEIRNQLYK
ncbi:DNA polymerase beta superfamily protein [Epilithonimonas zeae]|uniref:nucleotidyltransferase domain-containing protein n=1 Tax=Epilithonimonas zeae TaxID=1416779 RepID=UPI00200D5E9D|nr:nucleotidyltransferase domain-containing protein [Epilithonimonas zeae]UQB70514.1 nucleotidyltransferase domain-containing protein [Epilithonimonas zeae]